MNSIRSFLDGWYRYILDGLGLHAGTVTVSWTRQS